MTTPALRGVGVRGCGVGGWVRGWAGGEGRSGGGERERGWECHASAMQAIRRMRAATPALRAACIAPPPLALPPARPAPRTSTTRIHTRTPASHSRTSGRVASSRAQSSSRHTRSPPPGNAMQHNATDSNANPVSAAPQRGANECRQARRSRQSRAKLGCLLGRRGTCSATQRSVQPDMSPDRRCTGKWTACADGGWVGGGRVAWNGGRCGGRGAAGQSRAEHATTTTATRGAQCAPSPPITHTYTPRHTDPPPAHPPPTHPASAPPQPTCLPPCAGGGGR